VTVSPKPNTSRPSFFDMTGRAKWDAWDEVGRKYNGSAEAEARYLEIAKSLGWAENMQSVEVTQRDSLDEEEDGSSGPPTGMGPAVSAMLPPEELQDDSVHGLALAGKTVPLKALLDSQTGINLNGHDEYGYTPLHLACDRGNLEVVQLLVDRGVDTSTKDSDDLTPYEIAKIAGHDDIVKYLDSVKT